MMLESIEALPNATQQLLVEAVCSSNINIGDSLEVASSQDPLFWPIHPTLERLFVRSKLAGTFVNETWEGWSAYVDCL